MIRSEKFRRIKSSVVLVCATILVIYCLETREPQSQCEPTPEVPNATNQNQMEKNQTKENKMDESSNSYDAIMERQRQFASAKVLNAVKEMQKALNTSSNITDDHQHRNQLKTVKIMSAINQMEESLVSSDTTLLEPAALNRCPGSGSGLFLLAMVMSAPRNFEQRRVIRSTWAEMRGQWETEFLKENQNQSVVTQAVRLLFFLGQPRGNVSSDIHQEWNTHGDLVIDDFHDESNYTFTLKTLRMLRWVTLNCGSAQYVMKLHDNVFIHVPKLLKSLSFPKSQDQSSQQPRVVLGNVIRESVVYHDHSSEFFTPKILYSWEHYPTYLSDFCYVLGMGAAHEITDFVEGSKSKLKLFHIEDVFVIGIVANERLGIPQQQIAPILSSVNFVVETNRSLNIEPAHEDKTKSLEWVLQHVIIRPVTSDQIRCWTKFTGQGQRSLTEGC